MRNNFIHIAQLILLSILSGAFGASLNGLHVVGNKIKNSNNEDVLLRGVNRPGTEYSCVEHGKIFDGPNTQESINAMKLWKINSVRVPLNEDCWLGTGGVNPSLSGDNYIIPVANYVNLLTQNGMAVIVDLHWSSSSPGGSNASREQTPMPNKIQSTLLWTKVAETFKSNTAVLFDIFNEPFPDSNTWDSEIAWRCWKTGEGCPGLNYQAAGMQELVDIIRATGAQNIIMIGGIQFATSLVRWNEYKPNDPTGNLAAAVHVYDFNLCRSRGCWDIFWQPVLEQVPLIAGELGETDCATTFIDDFMDYADSHGVHYLAWAWLPSNCAEGPSIISDYSGTPTAYGAGYKNHLIQLDNGNVSPYSRSFPVYKDARSHWMDNWSWKNGTFLSFDDTTIVRSGIHSIGFQPASGSGLFFQCWSCIDTDLHKGMELWVHGGSTGGQTMRLTLVIISNKNQIPFGTSSTTKGPSVVLSDITTNGIIANNWVKAYLDFSTILSGVYDGFQIELNGEKSGILYFDDITVLAKNEPAVPSSSPSPSPSPSLQPSSSPTDVPTNSSSDSDALPLSSSMQHLPCWGLFVTSCFFLSFLVIN